MVVVFKRLCIFQAELCTPDDIVDELRPLQLAKTVQQLLSHLRVRSHDLMVTHLCIAILAVSCLVLFLFPFPPN